MRWIKDMVWVYASDLHCKTFWGFVGLHSYWESGQSPFHTYSAVLYSQGIRCCGCVHVHNFFASLAWISSSWHLESKLWLTHLRTLGGKEPAYLSILKNSSDHLACISWSVETVIWQSDANFIKPIKPFFFFLTYGSLYSSCHLMAKKTFCVFWVTWCSIWRK